MGVFVNNGSEAYPLRNPPYIRLYKFEKNFEFYKWRGIMEDYWGLCISIVLIYISLVFKGRSWMRERAPYQLRILLVSWNILLATFSVFAFRRNIPELYHLWFKVPHGLHITICSREHFSAGTAFWELIGIISKVIELGDTAFIVLRKQRLILLHWYHHATVLMFTWYTYSSHDPSHRFFMTMNYFVHVFLYTYYAFKALRYRMPKKLAMFVTSIQLIQMVIGIGANLYSLYVLENGGICERERSNIKLALGMYVSYFFLFSHFFYMTYVESTSTSTLSKRGSNEIGTASCACKHN